MILRLLQYANDSSLIGERVDGEGVVPGLQVRVVECGVANIYTVYTEVHRDVAKIDGEKRGIRYENLAVRIRAIRQRFGQEVEGEDL